jgi:hypothetical protein
MKAGTPWADEQFIRAHKGEAREFRVTNALLGVHSRKVLRRAGVLLRDSADDPRWLPYVEQVGASDESAFQAFRVLARSAAAVFVRFEIRRSKFPMVFFKLLREGHPEGDQASVDEFATLLENLCGKVLGEYAIQFRARYPTQALLVSVNARMEVYSVGVTLQLNIGFVEGGHAYCRRDMFLTGMAGPSTPLTTICAKHNARRVRQEAQWLDTSKCKALEWGEPSRIRGRGPWVWNEFQARYDWGDGNTTRAQHRELVKQAWTAFQSLSDADYDRYVDWAEDAKDARVMGAPLRKKARLERHCARRRERKLQESHTEAGRDLREEIIASIKECRVDRQARLEDEHNLRQAVHDVHHHKPLVDKACAMMEDLHDVRECLIPLSGGGPDSPMIFHLSPTPLDVCGPAAVTGEVWDKLLDPVQFREMSEKFEARHYLVKKRDARPLLKARTPPYSFRAGRCVCCGDNVAYLVLYKRLRKFFDQRLEKPLAKECRICFELTGPVQNQTPDGGRRRFFHIAHILGEQWAFMDLVFVCTMENDPPRFRLQPNFREDGELQFLDLWGISFLLIDTFQNQSICLTFYEVMTVGVERQPFEIRFLDVSLKTSVDRLGIRTESNLLWSGTMHEGALRAAPRVARPKAGPRPAPKPKPQPAPNSGGGSGGPGAAAAAAAAGIDAAGAKGGGRRRLRIWLERRTFPLGDPWIHSCSPMSIAMSSRGCAKGDLEMRFLLVSRGEPKK